MKHMLIMLALFCLTLLPAGAREPFAQIPPPQLVPCKSTTNCDRNPKHLEAFVEGFYRWYVDTDDASRMASSRELILLMRKQKNRYMKGMMTSRFKQWERIAFSDYEPKNHDFCPPDTGLIFCAQDYDKTEVLKTKARAITIGNNEAIIAFPIANQKLAIRLRVHMGAWHIDGATNYSYW